MRELTTHRAALTDTGVSVQVFDTPGETHYNLFDGSRWKQTFYFKNGMTMEVLLAIVIDRLEDFQAGPLECAHNQDALDHLRKGLQALHDRTLDRRARDVEGTSEP